MLYLLAAATIGLGTPVSDADLSDMRGARLSAYGQFERIRLAEERIVAVRLEQLDTWWATDGAMLIANADVAQRNSGFAALFQ